MPRTCTICGHPKRAEIDKALRDGEESNRRIAARFGVAEASIRRHKKNHLDSTTCTVKSVTVGSAGNPPKVSTEKPRWHWTSSGAVWTPPEGTLRVRTLKPWARRLLVPVGAVMDLPKDAAERLLLNGRVELLEG